MPLKNAGTMRNASPIHYKGPYKVFSENLMGARRRQYP